MVDYIQGVNDHPDLVPYLNQLELKPKPVLLHDTNAGAPCLKCGKCSGLELHYWRKQCLACRCRSDQHNIELPSEHEWSLAFRRQNRSPGRINENQLENLNEAFRTRNEQQANGLELGSRHGNEAGSEVQSTQTNSSYNESKQEIRSNSEFEWEPTKDSQLSRLYMQQMPEDERPICNTVGVQKRRQRLQYQLPAHDCFADKATSIKSEDARKDFEKFVQRAQQNVSMGQVIRTDEKSLHEYTQTTLQSQNGRQKTEKLICRGCKNIVLPDSVGILPNKAHGNQTDIWHPACFKCEQCHDLLVDLLYFFKDNKYLCGRHYCEKNFERCAGCDELIVDKQYTRAENQSWHVNHFCCFGCDKSFIDERTYVLKQGQFYCLECFLRKFAKTCLGCGQKIAAPEPYVTHNDLHWHKRPSCFRCRNCAKFLESKFLLKNQSIYCSDKCKKDFERITSC
ncbi:hypothetical protein M3Y97_00692800 [Aphelenchoides bicaudatus]|nr:hypothetical protein M3Y97_00692800 [Aphelenchoides bicaudatus]